MSDKKMSNLKFNQKGDLIPQKIKYKIKHNELDEETIEECIQNNYNFKIECNNEENTIFNKKNLIKK